jgi:hypothetical protein
MSKPYLHYKEHEKHLKMCNFASFYRFSPKKGQNYYTSKCAGPATSGPIFLWSMSTEPSLSPVSRFVFEKKI